MSKKYMSSMREVIEFLKERKEVLTVSSEVDPIYEISGILKSFDGGPAVLFENIKGYPQARNVGNIFSRMETIAKIFGIDDPRVFKFKCLEAIKNPILPKVVEDAPCQEVVITKDIDVMATLPIIKHTERDGGRILGGGNTLITGKYFGGGSHLSFNRMNFRGRDWASLNASPPTHLGTAAIIKYRNERVPLTINISTPPAVNIVAGGGLVHSVVPGGADELGIAGGLQGFPVEICKAKTVDAYAIAQSEWVIEGYLDPETVWETDEAEKIGEIMVAPFFPEWPGYLGRAMKLRKFQATAITHRRDRPIFFTPLAHSFEGSFAITPLREACFYEVAERCFAGLVVDVNIFHGLTAEGGVVYQVRKKRLREEGFQKNVLLAALAAGLGMRLVIAVDEDIDIYSAEDVLWALTTRVNPNTDIIQGARGGRGTMMMPIERLPALKGLFEGGIGVDATVPVEAKEEFERAKYPVDRVELGKWFSDEEIASARKLQNEYARLLAQTGG